MHVLLLLAIKKGSTIRRRDLELIGLTTESDGRAMGNASFLLIFFLLQTSKWVQGTEQRSARKLLNSKATKRAQKYWSRKWAGQWTYQKVEGWPYQDTGRGAKGLGENQEKAKKAKGPI